MGSVVPFLMTRCSILGRLLLTSSQKLCLGSVSSDPSICSFRLVYVIALLQIPGSVNMITNSRRNLMFYYTHLFIWRWEDEAAGQRAAGGSWFSLHHVMVRRGSKHLYLLSHFTSPNRLLSKNFQYIFPPNLPLQTTALFPPASTSSRP